MTDSAYPRTDLGPDHAAALRSFPALEDQVLDYWFHDDTFRASIERRDGAEEFVFYDGPPFANGLPHYGHLLTGYVKDIVPRYQTMRGIQGRAPLRLGLPRAAGRTRSERQLGITTNPQIDAMGSPRSTTHCRASVLRYTDEWRELRHAPGALGRLRQRLQDARPVLHGVA